MNMKRIINKLLITIITMGMLLCQLPELSVYAEVLRTTMPVIQVNEEVPTEEPTVAPEVSVVPEITPTPDVTVVPTIEPTVEPTPEVTVTPTPEVTVVPTPEVTVTPLPSEAPSAIEADTSWFDENKSDFILQNAAQLLGFTKLVNTGENFYGKTIRLGADIHLEGMNNSWLSIGYYNSEEDSFAFRGTFDGAGFIISGINIQSEDEYIGFFGYNRGIVKNVKLVNTQVSGRNYVGGIIGRNEGFSEGLVFEGKIKSSTDNAHDLIGFEQLGAHWNGSADVSWYDESKTNFSIATAEQLAGLAQLVNEGNSFVGKVITLEKDIDLLNAQRQTQNWTPIGSYTSADENRGFAGTFQGNNKTIFGLTIIAPEQNGLGLFGYLRGTVSDLNLEAVHLQEIIDQFQELF